MSKNDSGFDRLDAPKLPDGISAGTTSDKEFLILDFLTQRNLSKGMEQANTASFSSIVLSRRYAKYLKERIEEFLNENESESK